MRIDGEHVTFIAKFGKPCEYPEEEDICGRPLGLALDTQGDNLIVTDAYYGLWEVNLKTNQKKQLVQPDLVIGAHVSFKLSTNFILQIHQLSNFRFHDLPRCSTASRWPRTVTFSSPTHRLNSE